MKVLAYAIGTTTGQHNYKIFHGKSENVKRSVKKENNKYWSIYYYGTQLELDRYIEIDRDFFKGDMEGVEFIAV